MSVEDQDVEFQNSPETLRTAPWLDMVLLRKEAQKALLTAMEPGHDIAHYNTTFKNDLREFCEGKRTRIPRASGTISVLARTIQFTFPEYLNDKRKNRTRNKIYERLLQPENWGSYNRGEESRIS
jgi:hypothetical protein